MENYDKENEKRKEALDEFLKLLLNNFNGEALKYNIKMYGQFEVKGCEPFLAEIPEDISSN